MIAHIRFLDRPEWKVAQARLRYVGQNTAHLFNLGRKKLNDLADDGATLARQTIAFRWTATRFSDVRTRLHRELALLQHQSPGTITAFKGGIGILTVVAVRQAFHLPPSVNILLLLPILLATSSAGPVAGTALAAAATVFASSPLWPNSAELGSWVMSLAFHSAGFGGLVYLAERMRTNLIKTSDLALRDPLTGVLNRLGVTLGGEQTVASCLEANRPVIVVQIDLDDFKEINDTFGHTFGDFVLQTLAKCLNPAVARRGIVGRTGGDEFVMVFEGVSAEDVIASLARAKARFNDSTLVLGRRCEFSFGMASGPEGGVALSELIERADQLMYLQKAERKNQRVTMS